jgi:hypothetical protein
MQPDVETLSKHHRCQYASLPLRLLLLTITPTKGDAKPISQFWAMSRFLLKLVTVSLVKP